MPQSTQSSLPVVPMRNAVLFPGVTFPISAGRAATLRGIEAAMSTPERLDRKSTRLNSSHVTTSRMPSSA